MKNKTKLVVLLTVLLLATGVAMVQAKDEIVHDPEFLRMQKEFSRQWDADNKHVRSELATLQKRFGKKPNVVFILADDVGYT